MASFCGQTYFDHFFDDAENFFNESNFHLERTYGSKASAEFNDNPPTDGEFVDLNEISHSRFATPNHATLFAPRDLHVTRQLIGKKGSGFIHITHKSGVDFIWHDKLRNIITINGPQHNIPKATKMLQKQIGFIIRKMKKNNKKVLTNKHDHHVHAVLH